MISPLAYVNPDAKIGKDVTIHPFAYIDKNVEIGDNCTIMPYASILSGTRIGTNNTVYQGAIIGATPQGRRLLSTGELTRRIARLSVMETFCWKACI